MGRDEKIIDGHIVAAGSRHAVDVPGIQDRCVPSRKNRLHHLVLTVDLNENLREDPIGVHNPGGPLPMTLDTKAIAVLYCSARREGDVGCDDIGLCAPYFV